MAATGSTEPASTHIPGRDTNTRFADFADTTSPHVEKQSDTLASDRYRTAEATGMAGTGLHNTNADVTTTDRSLGNTGSTGTYSADKYKQNASGQPGYSAGTTHQKYNEPTSKYDTSTVTGKIKDKLDPNSRDLNTSGSYNDPTSKHDTSTLTGKIMDKLDPETGGVEPSGYAVDNSKQPLAGSVGDEPSGYGLKSSNKPSDVPYSTTAEPSGYGLDPSNADPKFSTATSAEPSGYGLEESKKHHLGTTTAAGVGAGVGAGAYAASHDSSRSHEYNDPTSKYDTSTVTGKIKDKLDPHSRDLNASGNYNDPTSKYGTSTTTGKYDTSTIDTGNMTEKVNPYSRNLNTSGNYNDPTSKYDTSTTTGKMKDKLDPHSRDLNTSGNYNDPTSKYGTSTTTGKYDTSTIDTGNMTEKVNPYSRNLNTSGNYNDPTSKYDTSTTTGNMKDKLDPHSRDLNTSGNYNNPTSKYDTSTTTGNMKDKLDPHSRDLNTSGNYNNPTSKYDTSTTTGNMKDKLDPHSRDLNTSGNYNNPTSKYDTSTTTGKMKDKLDPHSRDLNTSGNYGTSLGTTAGAGATHISTGTSGLGASNPAGNDSHLTKDTSSRSAFDNRQYGRDNEYSDTIPGSYPEKSYSSGTSTHVTDSPHLGKTNTTGFGGILDESIDYEDNTAPYDASYYGSGFTGHADTTKPDTKYDASRELGSGFTSGHVTGNSASKHDSHYNNPASKYDTSRYTGRVADKVDPTSRNRGATYDSQDTKHLNDPNSKYDTSKLTGRVADKLDPSSRKTEMTGSEDYSSSPDKAGSYDFREGKRFGEISPTLKYSDRSDKIQPSRLDSNHPTGAGLNASNTDSSTLPTTRGEEFLSEKEKKIVQEHFSNVNQNLKPGMPEVAGVAVFPLTHEQVQHATPRSQNAVTSEEGTDATTDKQKTSKKDYSLRT
ncbi:hypothetical protein DV495_001312 [Geotrichum candidum]|nr:hypothetical protein DV495_001312 [Geotrichum candidum]